MPEQSAARTIELLTKVIAGQERNVIEQNKLREAVESNTKRIDECDASWQAYRSKEEADSIRREERRRVLEAVGMRTDDSTPIPTGAPVQLEGVTNPLTILATWWSDSITGWMLVAMVAAAFLGVPGFVEVLDRVLPGESVEQPPVAPFPQPERIP